MATLLLIALSKGRTSLFVAILPLHCCPKTVQCLSCLPHDAAQTPKQALSRHRLLGLAPSLLPRTVHASHVLTCTWDGFCKAVSQSRCQQCRVVLQNRADVAQSAARDACYCQT